MNLDTTVRGCCTTLQGIADMRESHRVDKLSPPIVKTNADPETPSLLGGSLAIPLLMQLHLRENLQNREAKLGQQPGAPYCDDMRGKAVGFYVTK
jgi:hypothetical protein